jgi:hypothetical protein|tara:strand:+ start:1 stop:1221 length:1221 start_codon:yes stop_codon:yes gene_type:complete
MASIKLKHSGGNGVIIAAPTSNPASDKTLTLPSDVDGTVVSKDSSNSLQNITGVNGGQLSNRRININGAMICSQRGTSFTNIGSAGDYDDTYTLDRFFISQGLSAGRCSVTQESDAPSGFSKSLKIATTTADTSIAAGEYHRLLTNFEGQDLQRFAKGTSDAKQFTLSFYCKANASATYVAELRDTDNNRTISKTFSVTTSWTRVELTFAADTTGAFNSDNLLSMELAWWFHAGSTYSSGTLQTNWGSNTAANRAVGIDSIFDSTNRTFFITGVQLEVGDTATDFEHRTFAQELQLCRRYYILWIEGDQKFVCFGDHYSATQVDGGVQLPVEMRTTPTIDANTGANYYTIFSAGGSCNIDGGLTSYKTNKNGVLWYATGDSSRTAGHANRWISNNASAKIAFSAEL